jgi:hypothetical protein
MKLAYDFSYLGNDEDEEELKKPLAMEKRKRDDFINPIERSVLFYS